MFYDKLISFKYIFRRIVRHYKWWIFRKSHPYLICSYKDIIDNVVIDDGGGGNKVIVDGNSSIQDCNISFYGSNCTLHIENGVHLKKNNFWFEDEGGEIHIGYKTTTESGCQFASCESKKIILGADCMLSHEVDIRNTDSHSVLNERGERINPAADIIIGEHVWIGIRGTVLKGSVIPSYSVVAAHSIVTSSLEATEHTLISGSPAKVIKTNISWDRKRV